MMTRAEIVVGATHEDTLCESQSNYPVKLASGVIYYFFRDAANSDLWWIKSSDGGLTWTDAAAVFVGTAVLVSTWFDQWTPGNAGTLIHVAYVESTTHDVRYRSLDTSNDSLSTETVIFAGTSVAQPTNRCVSITRAIGGNLYCLFDIDAGAETGFARSTDVGATWGARDNTGGAEATDYFLLAPGFGADTQDILCVFWDRSADEISRKIYDDSGDTWAESSIAASMGDIVNSTSSPQFSITVDDANNKILLAAWSNRDTLNADLRFWSIDETTITEGTNIVLNSVDDQQGVALALDTATGDIYAFYQGKSDGSETAGTSLGVYYKVSTDDGATWGSETQLSILNRNYNYLMTCPVVAGSPIAVYQADAAIDYTFMNVELAAAGGASMLVHSGMSGGMRG